MSIVIAVDAMGGDRAPGVVVDGAVKAVERLDVSVVLVGPAAFLTDELARHDVRPSAISIVDAPDVITMSDSPLVALRRKPRSSIRVAADLVRSGDASAVFSAGHSGATVLVAHGAFGMLPGVDRPALAVTVPTLTGAAVLLDVGASVECRPEHLVQFALMGAAYATVVLGVTDRPRVGLLSIGEEAEKGNGLIRDAHARLRETDVNFIGNVEARELFTGRADVIVCDGFTGNIALKVGEGLVEAAEAMIREELGAELVTQIGARLSRRAFERFRQRVDYAEHGAAPLLGVGGVTLVGHGRSSSRAVESGIAMALRLVQGRVLERMTTAFEGHHDRRERASGGTQG